MFFILQKLAEELKTKLDLARNQASLQNNNINKKKGKEEFVLLTRTSSKGFSYPVKQAQSDKNNSNKKKREKVLTHEDGKRVRYFDDDDKYSLKSMVCTFVAQIFYILFSIIII